MQFNYVAYTLRDGVIKGNLDADNEAEARSEIGRMGYKLLSVGIKWQRPGLEQIFPSLFKVGTGELIRFARWIASYSLSSEVDNCSSAGAKLPVYSPASTTLTNRGLNTLGCWAMPDDKLPPSFRVF